VHSLCRHDEEEKEEEEREKNTCPSLLNLLNYSFILHKTNVCVLIYSSGSYVSFKRLSSNSDSLFIANILHTSETVALN
jgi:hypothetical protein